MYCSDLSPYQSLVEAGDPLSLNVGWLDGAHDYVRGDVPNSFLDLLLAYCTIPVHPMRGYHRCELCTEPVYRFRVPLTNGDLYLGSAEIRVFNNKGVAYAAPNLIYHYVADHRYCPPEEFIKAVLDGPPPDSPEYWEYAKQFQWGRMALRERMLLE
jgi:hypothetical protein